jgi:hypothetical protein
MTTHDTQKLPIHKRKLNQPIKTPKSLTHKPKNPKDPKYAQKMGQHKGILMHTLPKILCSLHRLYPTLNNRKFLNKTISSYDGIS